MTRDEAERQYVKWIMESGNPAYFVWKAVRDWGNEELAVQMAKWGDEVEIEALKKYAEAYKAYQIMKQRTFNIDVATQFAVEGLIAQARNDENYLIFLANDEADYILDAMAKEAA